MKVIILIHGAWHTGNCFERVKQVLSQQSNNQDLTVVNPHLHGHTPEKNTVLTELDPTNYGPLAQEYAQVSLSTYCQQLSEIVRQHVESGADEIHLLAHSMGGITVQHFVSTLDSELLKSIKSVIFLAAFLTRDNHHLQSYYLQKVQSPLLGHVVAPFERPPFVTLKLQGIEDKFYNEVKDESVLKQALADLVYEPTIPHVTPVQNKLKDIPIKQVYIETLKDNAMNLEQQRYIVNEQREDGNTHLQVVSMDCDHSPFYSCPEQLADCLLSIVDNKQ